jgi:hypothetical protein
MMPRKTVAAGSGFRATQPSQIFAEPRMDRAPRFAQLSRPDGYWDFCLIGAPFAVGSPADLRRAVREIRGRLLLSAAWSVPFHHHDSHRRLLLGRRRPDFLIADMTMLLFHESSTRYIRKRFDSGVHEWKQIGYVDGLALWAKSFREIHHNL